MQAYRKYELLFYLGVLLMGCLWLCVSICNEFKEIRQKHSEQKVLLKQVEDAKNIVMHAMQAKTLSILHLDNTVIDTANAISYLTPFFEAQEMRIEKIQFLKIKTVEGVNVLPIKMNVTSQFSAFYHLLIALNESDCPLMLNDFKFEQDRQGAVVAKLQFYLFGLRLNERENNRILE